ncbi:hypothetical protein [Parendozoicomonas sp. Alg238-R29]|uniref:hypothetical protein n=1 Tax=Parendozoicomonas sp. Alg238-R29 TaxID=2993446 RepID=UPI00248E0702|nr:hypothetical protein [Parendozoicomonas sp. Alg238-R29]
MSTGQPLQLVQATVKARLALLPRFALIPVQGDHTATGYIFQIAFLQQGQRIKEMPVPLIEYDQSTGIGSVQLAGHQMAIAKTKG